MQDGNNSLTLMRSAHFDTAVIGAVRATSACLYG